MRMVLFTLLVTLFFSCKKSIDVVVLDEAPIEDSTLNNSIIVCDGNSITWGQTWGTPFPEQLQQTLPFKTNGTRVYNKGKSGQQTSDMTADATVDIDTLYNSSVRSILIAWEMSNDLTYNGNVNGAINNMRTYCNARKAKGWQVIVMSILPRYQATLFDDPTSLQKKIDQANAILKVDWKEFADGYIDVGSDNRLLDPLNKNYFVDGIHLNTNGMHIIKNLAIKELKFLK